MNMNVTRSLFSRRVAAFASSVAPVGAGLLVAAAALLSPTRAAGALVVVEASTKLVSGQGEDFHDVFIQNFGTDLAAAEDQHGPNHAAATGWAGSSAIWGTEASFSIVGSQQYPGTIAIADAVVIITDEVIIDTSGEVNLGEIINWSQPLYISGTTTGNATAPGEFVVDGSYAVTFGDEVIGQGVQSLTSDGGFTNILPPTAFIEFQAPAGGLINLRFVFRASAFGYTLENAGAATGNSDYGSTFSWGEATNVMNLTTGQPIDAADFHLLGADGFDWAHPVPEPAAAIPLALLAALTKRRRRSAT